jgi:predicted PurR-regulated permease PerM
MANSWRIALWAAIVVAALAFLYMVRGVLLPFALSYVIAVLLEPLVRRLRLLGLKRGLSVGIITFVFFGLFAGVLIYAIPRLTGQVGDLRSSIQTMADTLAQENRDDSHFNRWNPVARAQPPGPIGFVDEMLEQLAPSLDKMGLPTNRQSIYEQYVAPQRDELGKTVSGFINGFVQFVGAAASQVMLFAFVPLIVFLFLLEMEEFRLKFMGWIPPTIRRGTLSMIEEIGEVFKNYLRGVTINVLCYTAWVAIVLSVMGVPYSLIVALFIGTVYLIPMVNGMISTPTVFLVTALSGVKGGPIFHSDSPWVFGAICAAVFIGCSTVYDSVVTPNIVGRSVKLSPLVSMFVVFAGGAAFGLPGMLLAFPVAGAVKVTLARLMRLTNQSQPKDLPLPPSVPLRHRSIGEA